MRGTENLNATRRSICGPLPIPFLNAGMKIALQGEEDEVCHALVVWIHCPDGILPPLRCVRLNSLPEPAPGHPVFALREHGTRDVLAGGQRSVPLLPPLPPPRICSLLHFSRSPLLDIAHSSLSKASGSKLRQDPMGG